MTGYASGVQSVTLGNARCTIVDNRRSLSVHPSTKGFHYHMTRHVRSWAIAALAVFALTGSATPSFASIIYKVTNDLPDQNGWSIAGTITLGETGTYQTNDEVHAAIRAFAFEFTNGNVSDTWSFNSTQSSAGVGWLDNNGGTLEATSTTLTLGSHGWLSFQADAGRNFRWENGYFGTTKYAAGDGGRFWNSSTFSPTTSGGGWIIGSVEPVPEIDPAGMGSVLALVSGALALLERRRLKVA